MISISVVKALALLGADALRTLGFANVPNVYEESPEVVDTKLQG